MTTSSGIAGMTRKTFISEVDDLVDDATEYAAMIPSIAASVVARSAARAEDQRAAGAEHDLREDVAALVGRAEQVVPRRRLMGGEDVEVGRDARPRSTARSAAMTTTKPTIARPIRDFRLRAGARATRAVRPAVHVAAAATRAGCRAASSWARAATSARPQPRVEDEVEDVHDQVGGDHAERENEQQPLRERVVVPEHRLLQRQPAPG